MAKWHSYTVDGSHDHGNHIYGSMIKVYLRPELKSDALSLINLANNSGIEFNHDVYTC